MAPFPVFGRDGNPESSTSSVTPTEILPTSSPSTSPSFTPSSSAATTTSSSRAQSPTPPSTSTVSLSSSSPVTTTSAASASQTVSLSHGSSPSSGGSSPSTLMPNSSSSHATTHSSVSSGPNASSFSTLSLSTESVTPSSQSTADSESVSLTSTSSVPRATPHASLSSMSTSSGDGGKDSLTVSSESRSLESTVSNTSSATGSGDVVAPTTTLSETLSTSLDASSTSATSTGTSQPASSSGSSSSSGSQSVTGTGSDTASSTTGTGTVTDASTTTTLTSESTSLESTSGSESLSLSNSQSTTETSISISTSGSLTFTFSDSGSASSTNSISQPNSSSSSTPTPNTPASPSTEDSSSTHTIVQGGRVTTYVISTIVTTVDGQTRTLTSTIPIGINAAPPVSEPNNNSAHSQAIIGGVVGGSVALLALAFVGFCLWRRQRYRTATAHRRLVGAPASMDQHDMDHFDLAASAAIGQRYRDPTDPFADDDDSLDAPLPGPLMRPHASGTGSIFHETGIWPPPRSGSRMRDPLLNGSEIELSGIVDNTMGSRTTSPSSPIATGSQRLRGGHASEDAMDPFSDTNNGNVFRTHVRSSTGGSIEGVTAPLLTSLQNHSRFGSVSDPPVRSRLALVTPEVDDQGALSSKARDVIRNSSSGPAILPVGQLVDVEADVGAPMPAELPPQYHTIRRDSVQSTESAYSEETRASGERMR